MNCTATRKSDAKRGIALIAVLGFLSIFILMAVAFMANMRTERLVSESGKEETRARQLLRGSVASAMDNVDEVLSENDLSTDSPAPGSIPRPVNIRLPKSWAIIWSSAPSGPYTNLGDNVRLISGEASNWIPRRYLSNLDADFDAAEKAANADWVFVKDPYPSGGATNRILGRYGFVALDCTGQLDANKVEDPAANPRSNGVSVAEISTATLPEVNGVQRARYLHANRTNYCRFGTFPEILLLNDGVANVSGYPEPATLVMSRVNNLAPYSLCYDAGWWDWSAQRWNLPRDVRGWTAADAKTAFLDAGFTEDQAEQMKQCFVDYTDADFLPQSLTIPCCEPVPMINEIIFSGELSLSGANELKYTIKVDVECWFPFLGANNDHDYEIAIEPPPVMLFDIQSASGTSIFTLNPPATPPVDMALNPTKPTTPFMVTQTPLKYEYTYTFPAAPTFPVQVRCNSIKGIHVVVTDVSKSEVVDEVNFGGTAIAGNVPLLRLTGAGTVGTANPVSLSVMDPRLNHLVNIGSERNWNSAVATKGAMNDRTALANLMVSVNGDYEGSEMYVRNSTNLGSVAELGFIPTGDRWSTIDLFTPAGQILLNKYRTCSLTAKTYTNGLINPNSSYSNVIKAAFLDAPIEQYPGDPSPNKVDEAMANEIVSGFSSVEGNKATRASNTFYFAAGWVTTSAFAVKGALMDTTYRSAPYNMDNTKKESIIRNTYRLFNPNQNLFTIVVIAQSIIDNGKQGTWEPDEDVITGEKRAVALVWRDPFPDPDTGRHEMFVRLFKYLDE